MAYLSGCKVDLLGETWSDPGRAPDLEATSFFILLFGAEWLAGHARLPHRARGRKFSAFCFLTSLASIFNANNRVTADSLEF